jgi:hypothetical protein
MKLKFIIMFKNGKIKTYKTKYMNDEECKENEKKYKEFFQQAFQGDISGYFTVKEYTIRISDISSINIKKVLI